LPNAAIRKRSNGPLGPARPNTGRRPYKLAWTGHLLHCEPSARRVDAGRLRALQVPNGRTAITSSPLRPHGRQSVIQPLTILRSPIRRRPGLAPRGSLEGTLDISGYSVEAAAGPARPSSPFPRCFNHLLGGLRARYVGASKPGTETQAVSLDRSFSAWSAAVCLGSGSRPGRLRHIACNNQGMHFQRHDRPPRRDDLMAACPTRGRDIMRSCSHRSSSTSALECWSGAGPALFLRRRVAPRDADCGYLNDEAERTCLEPVFCFNSI